MRRLLLTAIITIAMQTADAEEVCKTMQQSSTYSVKKEVDAKDWDCGTVNIFRGPELEIFNHTEHSIYRIELQGRKTLGLNTRIAPRTSQTFRIDNPSLCEQPYLNLKMFYTKTFTKKAKCIEYYTASELAAKKQREIRARVQEEAQREVQTQMNILRDNCIISKGKNAADAVLQEIRRVCTEISKNPSVIQKFRWGS